MWSTTVRILVRIQTLGLLLAKFGVELQLRKKYVRAETSALGLETRRKGAREDVGKIISTRLDAR